MQSILDTIHTIARQRGRGEHGPLLWLRQLGDRPGERVSHLPLSVELSQAWQAITGEPFRPHQAQAFASFRRGEPVALQASSPSVAITAYLLLFATLNNEPSATGLIIVPDAAALEPTRAALEQINNELPVNLRLSVATVAPHMRPQHGTRLLIATPATLHHRLLRHHERGWSAFWRRLRLVLLLDAHAYHGVTGAHVADLLLRLQRVASFYTGSQTPDLLATLVDVADSQAALEALTGYTWRIIRCDDIPADTVTFGLWRGAADRLREVTELALALQRHGYHVHIRCRPLESFALTPVIGDAERITFGQDAIPAHVLICAGYPGNLSQIRRFLQANYQAVIVVLGELPHEQMLVRHHEGLLSEPPTAWPPLPSNAYVTAQHILCAASELALTDAEVESWGVRDIMERLVNHGQLVDLPDPEVAWKPTAAASDPYAEFSLLSSSGGAISVKSEQEQPVTTVDPSGLERWAFPNAALPPGAGGVRVIGHSDNADSISIRLENSGRRTYPLRRAEITLREERETRALLTTGRAGLGRVLVDEEIYGYREMSATSAPIEMALQPPLVTRWVAPACWLELPNEVQPVGQFIGWCLAAALPLRALGSFTDMVPCYDRKKRRLYVVDAQPGGSGLAAWMYHNLEQLLPLAYDIALACRNDPLLEPLSRVEMDWLLAMLGYRATQPQPAGPPDAPLHVEQPAPRPPQRAEAPRIILTPAPDPMPPAQPTSSIDEPAVLRQPRPASAPEPEPQAPPKRPPQPEQMHSRGARRPPPNMRDTRIRAARKATGPAPTPRPASERTAPPEHARAASSAPEVPSDPAPPPARPPDASALIQRLQRQRQLREAEQGYAATPPTRPTPAPGKIEPRFAPGDRVFCLPYGDGTVQSSQIEDDREVLTVRFPDHGELVIDSTVSLVRKLDDAPPSNDDLL